MAEKLSDAELVEVTGGAYTGPCFPYRIKNGESLLSIARQFGTTAEIIRKINSIPDTAQVCDAQKILIPYK